MAEKLLVNEQVTIISERLNIPFTTVKTVLKSYTSLLVEEIYLGMEVRVGWLIRIIPEKVSSSYLATTGYEASLISKNTGVPYITCSSILTSYLELVVDAVTNQRDFDIIGVVNVKSEFDVKTNELKVYTNISRVLTESLKEMGKSVRVKFNINLRHLLKSEVTS